MQEETKDAGKKSVAERSEAPVSETDEFVSCDDGDKGIVSG